MRKGLVNAGAGLLAATALVVGCGSDSASSPSGGGGADGLTGGTGGVSGGSGGTGGAPVVEPRSLLAACRAYIRAACERRYDCGILQDMESCASTYWYACPDYLFAPGSARTAEGMFACAEDFADHDCSALARNINPPCSVAGTRVPGEACVSPIQCASFRCSSVVSDCGVCATPVAAGEACNQETDACPVGYRCDGTCVEQPVGTLTPPQDREVGEACNGNDRCPEGYVCSHPATDLSGVCELPRQIGETCMDLGNIMGVCVEAAYCDPVSSLCVARPVAGEPCGMLDSGFVLCAPGSTCSAATSPDQPQGTCVALVPAGSPCDNPSSGITVGYANCESGLACAPDGICKEMVPEGYPCPEPGALAFCEVRTSCVDGVCTADDTFALYESVCGQD